VNLGVEELISGVALKELSESYGELLTPRTIVIIASDTRTVQPGSSAARIAKIKRAGPAGDLAEPVTVGAMASLPLGASVC